MGILDSIVEWIATQVMNLLDLITGSVLGALGCDMSTFLRYFPAAETLYEIFVAIGVFVAVKSRIDAWTLLRVLVVPCLFLCAIFKRPVFQWIACAALFVWVCFVISKLFRAHRKHCKKMPAEQKAFPAKQETKPLTETPQEADDDTRLSLLRQVNYRIMEQLKQSYPTVR